VIELGGFEMGCGPALPFIMTSVGSFIRRDAPRLIAREQLAERRPGSSSK
jgi:hypothetical protein